MARTITTRERLLDVAAKELAEHGYAGASLSRILTSAGVGKSAAYHHFSDKADLAVTVLERFWNVAELERLANPAALTRETFWPALRVMHTHQFQLAKDEPWMWSTMRCAWDVIVSVPPEHPAARRLERIVAWGFRLIERGRKLGVIRKDLPPSLLEALMIAFDSAANRWMSQHGKALSKAKLRAVCESLQDLSFAMLAPKAMQ